MAIKMGRTRLVKLSEEEYQLLQKAKRELARSGTGSLPEKVKKEAEEGHVSLADFALGAIVGLGALALIAALLKE
jgi:hypothetical protein